MGKKDPRVDAYIEKSAAFAKPILNHIRAVVHQGCPEVEETMKWSFPHFMYKGILCSMASFKGHCAFGFWKASLLEPGASPSGDAGSGMGQFGRVASIDDLPSKRTLLGYVKKAAALNESGVSRPRPARTAARPLAIPDDLARALSRNRKARATFEAFSPSHKREYIEWITGAKREETRQRRLETTMAWLVEGKVHNWKYVSR